MKRIGEGDIHKIPIKKQNFSRFTYTTEIKYLLSKLLFALTAGEKCA